MRFSTLFRTNARNFHAGRICFVLFFKDRLQQDGLAQNGTNKEQGKLIFRDFRFRWFNMYVYIDHFGTAFKNLFFNRFRDRMPVEYRHMAVENQVQVHLEITAHISCSNPMRLKDGRVAFSK